MQKRLLIIILLAAIAASCSPIYAQQLLVKRYIEQGGKALDDGEYKKAEELFSAALKEATGTNDDAALLATYMLSLSELKLGKNREAEKMLTHALQAGGTNATAETTLRFKFALGRAYLAEDKLELAETTLRAALKLVEASNRPVDSRIGADIVNSLAEVFRKRGKIAEADALMTPIEKPGEPRLATSKSMIELAEQLDNDLNSEPGVPYEAAKEALDVSLASNPSDYKGLCARGSLHLQFGHLDKAELDFRPANNIAPQLAAAIVGLGRIDCRRGNFNDAILRYNQALTIEPGSTAVLANRAIARWLNGEREIAMDDLNSVINQEPLNSKLKLLKDRLAKTQSTSLTPSITLPGIGAMATPQVPQRNSSSVASDKSTTIDELVNKKSATKDEESISDKDPDADDAELIAAWGRWRNLILRSVQSSVQLSLNNPDDSLLRWDPQRNVILKKFPLGTVAWFSCQVTPDRHISQFKLLRSSGFPNYDKAVQSAVYSLEGSSILKFPPRSRRRIVTQVVGIKCDDSEVQFTLPQG